MNVCLDSWTVLAWLDGEEPARSRLDELMIGRPLMCWVNLVEVYYRVERVHGRREADLTLRQLKRLMSLELPGEARMVEAARVKSLRAIALGDCFAIVTAAAAEIPLLTGDPEILGQKDLPCRVEDLRGRTSS